jgi:cytochrome c oxidase subunit I
LAFTVTFMPMHWTGLVGGMPRRVYTYGPELNVTGLNQVSTVGALALGLSVLIFVVNAFISLRGGKLAGGDPWDGATLEWSIPSPPPVYNFARIPAVHSRDAFWALKHPDWVHGAVAHASSAAADPHEWQGAHASDEPPVIHMPSPSYFPLMIAMGLLVGASGILITYIAGAFGYAVSATGVLVILAGIFGWSYEPA